MEHIIQKHVWAVRDKLGNIHIEVTGEEGDSIFVEASIDDWKTVEFESDAYHLESWCLRNGFDYFHSLQDIGVELLFAR